MQAHPERAEPMSAGDVRRAVTTVLVHPDVLARALREADSSHDSLETVAAALHLGPRVANAVVDGLDALRLGLRLDLAAQTRARRRRRQPRALRPRCHRRGRGDLLICASRGRVPPLARPLPPWRTGRAMQVPQLPVRAVTAEPRVRYILVGPSPILYRG